MIEDSNHQKRTVAENLAAYHRFVTPGSYFIVQDTRVVEPVNAIKPFLRDHPCFVVDRRPEYYYITQHWGGYLYKRRAASGCADESAHNAAAAASTPAQSRRRRRPG